MRKSAKWKLGEVLMTFEARERATTSEQWRRAKELLFSLPGCFCFHNQANPDLRVRKTL